MLYIIQLNLKKLILEFYNKLIKSFSAFAIQIRTKKIKLCQFLFRQRVLNIEIEYY